LKVAVLGAGVVGTTSAWYLAQAGHQVTVIERQPVAGNETSFANGGQISVSHAEPWANPHVLPRVLKWLGREDAPLLWRWRADPAQLAWGLRFLRECLPGRTRANIAAIVALALYSRRCLQRLREDFASAGQPLAYDHLQRGILHIYSDPAEFELAQRAAATMRSFGLDRHTVDAAECRKIEPALAACALPLVGGDYTASDESGDAHRFTRALAERAAAAGVAFRYATRVDRIEVAAGEVQGVWLQPADAPAEHLQADARDALWRAEAYRHESEKGSHSDTRCCGCGYADQVRVRREGAILEKVGRQKAQKGSHGHDPLASQVEHAGALIEHFAQRGEKKGHGKGNPERENIEDDVADVHLAILPLRPPPLSGARLRPKRRVMKRTALSLA